MNPFTSAYTAWSVLRSPLIERPALKRLQNQKLRRILRHAWQYVPYYRRLFDRVGLDPDSIESVEDLARLPVTTKSDLLAAGSDAISSYYRRNELLSLRTTGSTGEPMTLYFDRHFEQVRKMLFLRALLSVGYRPGERLLLMKSSRAQHSPGWTRFDTIPFDVSPETMLSRILETRPRYLYGWVTPIRELASFIRDAQVRIAGLRAVITTAEALDGNTRELLHSAFDVPVYNFYGLTEMGTVAWECSHHDGLHLSEDVVFVESDSGFAAADQQTMIMTNLELTSMPLIRYQTGDLATPYNTNSCVCGRGFHRIRQVSGRQVDCLRLPSGRVLSPYAITLALEPVPGLCRYQVIQERTDSLIVRYEGEDRADISIPDGVRSALANIVDDQVRIEVRQEDRIQCQPGRKFRVVESRVGAQR